MVGHNQLWWVVTNVLVLAYVPMEIHMIYRDLGESPVCTLHVRSQHRSPVSRWMVASDCSRGYTMFTPRCIRSVGCLVLQPFAFGWRKWSLNNLYLGYVLMVIVIEMLLDPRLQIQIFLSHHFQMLLVVLLPHLLLRSRLVVLLHTKLSLEWVDIAVWWLN